MENASNPPPATPPPPRRRSVRRISWLLYPVLFPIALLIRLWQRTLRVRITPEDFTQWNSLAGGRLVVLWHNRLFPTLEVRRVLGPVVPMNALISASKDGAWLTVFFKLLRLGVVRGSSSWRGAAALLEIVRLLKAGEDVTITPDGPRGPCYKMAASVAQLARSTDFTIVLADFNFHAGRRLRSWDGFYLPLPFSRLDVRLDVVRPDDPDRQLDEQALTARLRERMLAMTDDSKFRWEPKRKHPRSGTISPAPPR